MAGNNVSPSAPFKGSGLSLPNIGGLRWFSHASILSELLDLCSDLIPVTVFELQLPQTSPDSGEEEKTDSTLLEKWQAGLVGVRVLKRQHFGGKGPPSI